MDSFSLYRWMLGNPQGASLTVRAYTARTVFSGRPTVGNFTEAAYTGYSRIPFPPPALTQPISPGIAFLALPGLTFQATSFDPPPPPLAGLFTVATLADSSEVVLAWFDFDAPQNLAGPGGLLVEQYSVTAQDYVVTP